MMGELTPCPGGSDGLHCAPLTRLVFPGEPLAVRKALQRVLQQLRDIPLREEDCGTVEIVLAEVLNNIVEHAYAAQESGLIELSISHRTDTLCVELADNGAPMPGGTPPDTQQVVFGHSLEKLPEGGFGWFLIRSMADRLTYRREEGCNHLTFRLRLGAHDV